MSAGPVEAERRQVSVVFADLSGFTALAERHDPEDVREVVEEFFALGREAVERWGGRVDQYAGDALMAVFGDRVSREDDTERAVRAALAVRDAAATVRTPLARGSGGGLFLRAHVGVATGLAVTAGGTGPSGVTSPMGDAVNVAARLQGLAEAGQVLVCGTTHRLLGHRVAARALGERPVRGRSGVVDVFAVETGPVTPPPRSRSGHRGRLVGRDTELADLTGAWRRLVTEGVGTSVLVVAEAGGGKSRLLDELADVVERHDGTRWLEGRAGLLGRSAVDGPLREVVSDVAGIGDDDDETTVRDRLTGTVRRLGLAGADVLGPLLRLFAAEDDDEAEQDRESYRRRLTAAMETLLRAEGARGPLVLCLQDLHWAEEATVELVSALTGRLAGTVLVVLDARPGHAVDVLRRAGVRELRLPDLAPDELGELVAARLGSPAAPGLLTLVVERSGGNPFFAEEVLNSLRDADALVEGPDGWHLADGHAADDVPGTVQGVIAARLDLLPASARHCLRVAGVYGREFALDDLLGLGEAAGDPAGLPAALATLVQADLLRDVAPDRFRFKHRLTLEVAWDGLTRARRRALHLAAALSLEQRAGRRPAELAELLGAHYRDAGAVAPAVQHLSTAARGALDRYAVAEADASYRDAYRLLVEQGEPAQRIELLGPLLVSWALVHYYRGTWREADDLLQRHEGEITASPDQAVLGMSLAWRGFSAAIARSALGQAVALLDEAVAIGDRLDHPELLAHACTWRAWALFLAGRHDEALADARRVERVSEELVDARFPRIKSAGAKGLAHIGRGDFDEAARVADWLVGTGARTGSTRATSMGLSVRSLAATLTGDATGGADTGAQAVASATDPIYTDMARLMAVHGMVAAGRLEAARAVHADMVASCTALRLDGLLLAVSSGHAVLRVLEGDLSAGMRQLETSIDRADADGSRFLASLARVYRAAVHARVAVGAARVGPGSVLRNPGFVLRHVLPGRRRARAELTELLRTLPEHGGAGLCVLAAAELERLGPGPSPAPTTSGARTPRGG